MVQTEGHRMRPECAKEFGSIQTSLEFHKEWRVEQLRKLDALQREIEKLTGNGNRGKIDDLASSISSIEKLLADHIVRSEAGQFRISGFEERITELDKRVFSTAIKVAGAVGLLIIVVEYIWRVVLS